MAKLLSQAFFTMWTIINVNCEHWYSATVVDRVHHNNALKGTEDPIKIFNENILIPVALAHTDDRPKTRHFTSTNKLRKTTGSHHLLASQEKGVKDALMLNELGVYGTSDVNVDYYTLRNASNKPVEVVNYNNTVNVINVIKRPRRKIVKRRCHNVNFRKNKQLDLKKGTRPRFLEVFQVVEFEHVTCISSSGLEGTCLHEYECEASGGSLMGTCADGYGFCCVTEFLCDGQSSELVGWFSNPGYPSPSAERLSCTFTLNKASEDITQIRLDFVLFELLGPTEGTCQQDQFVVSGQNTNNPIPILCGINTGQHVYLEVGDTDGPIYLSVQTSTAENRLFSIKVSQLSSTDELVAPSGCLQYFTEPEGVLETFNYSDKSEIGIARTSSYLNNLNYATCIQRAKETCSVTYTNADTMQILNYDLDGLPIIPQGQAGVEIFNCPSDWILISAIRLCGERLNDGSVIQDFSMDAPVTDSNAGPIAVWFRTDEGYTGRGFKLQYKQNICNGAA